LVAGSGSYGAGASQWGPPADRDDANRCGGPGDSLSRTHVGGQGRSRGKRAEAGQRQYWHGAGSCRPSARSNARPGRS